MSSKPALRVTGLGKMYQIYNRPEDRLKQYVLPRVPLLDRYLKRQYFHEFWALQDVSFEVQPGETFGIIGRNGSGKSTLLQLICGTLHPSTGTVEVNGRVGALLELGAGFNPEFSGLENVYLSGALYGLTTAQIEARLADIEAFADIGEFIRQPVKTYSSGMFVRLAFAVIAHIDADILVIDEALSVGDAFFVQKCMRFLRNFMQRGTLLFVSHDSGAVLNLCSRALLLNRGRSEMIGAPKAVTEHYLASLHEAAYGASVTGKAAGGAPDPPEFEQDARADLVSRSTLRNDLQIFRFRPDSPAFGLGGALITSVRLFDEHGRPLAWTVGGEVVRLEIRCSAATAMEQPVVGFMLKDRLGQAVFGDNTFLTYRLEPRRVEAGGELEANFVFRIPVLPVGDYSFSVAVAEGTQDNHVQHHWVHDALIIKSHASAVCFGAVGVPMRSITLTAR